MAFLEVEAMHGGVLRFTLIVNSELPCTKSLQTSLYRRMILGLFCIGSTKKWFLDVYHVLCCTVCFGVVKTEFEKI